MKSRRRLLVALAAATAVLTGCGSSPPPAKELADEMIDTLENDGGPVSDEIKDCMHDQVDAFELTDDERQQFDSLDDAADKAEGDNAAAKAVIERFRQALASCNTPG